LAAVQQKEIVAPAQNFEEVIGSVAATRAAKKLDGAPGGGSPSNITVTVKLLGNAGRFLQVQAIQDQSTGTYRG